MRYKWRVRSACASAQSDKSLRSPPKDALGPWLFIDRTVKSMIRLRVCAGWSVFAGCTSQKYTERKKKRRVNFIPKFHSSLKQFVKYFTMITKRYMYGTKVPNFIGLWSTSLELLKFIGSYTSNLEIKIKLKINIGCTPLLLPLLP